MNIFKKVYCRAYQLAFRCIMPFLPYRQPKILTNYSSLAEIVTNLGVKNVLVVVDKNIELLGLMNELDTHLKDAHINAFIYDKTVPNPTTDNVMEGLEIYNKNGCGAIIALGGGSIMDCAKAIGAKVARPKKDLNKMGGVLKVRKKTPPIFAIPTTAGTGSETTIASVITDSKTRHKYAINDFVLIPSYAILDASLTQGLPPIITATTGMDALTHAVEAFIGRSTTKKTRGYALSAMRLIFDNILVVYKDGKNLNARKNMLKASYLAGLAFTQSYVGYVHAVAHSLGGKYNVAHGEANAILLPVVLKKYGKSIYKKLQKICLALNFCDKSLSKEDCAKLFIEKIEKLDEEMNISKNIPQIKLEDIPQLAKVADKEANPLYPVPRLYDAKSLQQIYYEVME